MIPSGKARLAGVMGWPVEHSLSPRLHGYWLKHHRIDGAYVPLAVGPEDLRTALTALPALASLFGGSPPSLGFASLRGGFAALLGVRSSHREREAERRSER